ncbi:MAG TPA: lysozyme [Sphingomonas sp.]|nr:lysozyme [Sphingomonas sp.]
MPDRKPLAAKGKVGLGLASASAIALTMAVAALKTDEGKRNVTYLDIARVPTYCFGHADRTATPGSYHSDAECDALLTADARQTEAAVLKCTPVLADRPHQLAAATRLAFNIGSGAYCRSTVARRFNAKQWRAACDGFLAWRYAGGRAVAGLLARRERERAQCLEGL